MARMLGTHAPLGEIQPRLFNAFLFFPFRHGCYTPRLGEYTTSRVSMKRVEFWISRGWKNLGLKSAQRIRATLLMNATRPRYRTQKTFLFPLSFSSMFVLLTKLHLLIENEYFSVASQKTRSPSLAYKKEFASDKSLDNRHARAFLSFVRATFSARTTRDVFLASIVSTVLNRDRQSLFRGKMDGKVKDFHWRKTLPRSIRVRGESRSILAILWKRMDLYFYLCTHWWNTTRQVFIETSPWNRWHWFCKSVTASAIYRGSL